MIKNFKIKKYFPFFQPIGVGIIRYCAMSESKYFTPSRLTRSSCVSNDLKDADSPIIGTTNRLGRSKQTASVNNYGAKSLSDKLKRKREHLDIKIENDDRKCVQLDASNSPSIHTVLNIDVKVEPGLYTPQGEAVQGTVWQPPLWRQQLENIYEIRKAWDAPVDTMGCDVISDEKAKPEVDKSLL